MAITFDVGKKPAVEFELGSVRVIEVGGGGGNVSSKQISTIVSLDKAAYDALPVKDSKTLYLIEG